VATSVCVSWACVFTALSGFAFTAAFLATFGFQAALAHGRFVASAGVSPPTTSRGKPLHPARFAIQAAPTSRPRLGSLKAKMARRVFAIK
jgi:hypothetical protein